MILIVADTGPVNYLVQIGCIGLLAQLAEKTVLPASVQAELAHRGAPDAVRAWATALPAWVEVREATQLVEAKDISPADREAIALAKELGAAVRCKPGGCDDGNGRLAGSGHCARTRVAAGGAGKAARHFVFPHRRLDRKRAQSGRGTAAHVAAACRETSPLAATE